MYIRMEYSTPDTSQRLIVIKKNPPTGCCPCAAPIGLLPILLADAAPLAPSSPLPVRYPQPSLSSSDHMPPPPLASPPGCHACLLPHLLLSHDSRRSAVGKREGKGFVASVGHLPVKLHHAASSDSSSAASPKFPQRRPPLFHRLR
jgi:hypothetical protein